MITIDRINELAHEAKDNNQKEIAVILFTLAGAMSARAEFELATLCSKFTDILLEEISKKKSDG
jgi:hypothetical protein